MKEFIFYTHKGITMGADISASVENCQLLGREIGDNLEQARQNLIRNNPWIEEAGFDIHKIRSVQIVNDEIRHNIQRLVEYVLKDKRLQYEDNNHISMAIQNIKDDILNVSNC